MDDVDKCAHRACSDQATNEARVAREREEHRRAFSDDAFRPDAAAMAADDPPDDRESDSPPCKIFL